MDIAECPVKDSCGKYHSGKCDPEANFCIRLFKIDALQNNALLTKDQRRYIPLRLDADKRDLNAFTQLRDIEQNIETHIKNGDNLYLYSRFCGNGKTRWALRLLNKYFERIWYESDPEACRGLFINVPRFLLALKDNITQRSDYVQHIKDNVLDADLVIWDEVGSKGLTTFENENILSMINSRIDSCKSNIYTSNLSADELKTAVGDRLYSRIFHMSKTIEFLGADKRGL